MIRPKNRGDYIQGPDIVVPYHVGYVIDVGCRICFRTPLDELNAQLEEKPQAAKCLK